LREGGGLKIGPAVEKI